MSNRIAFNLCTCKEESTISAPICKLISLLIGYRKIIQLHVLCSLIAPLAPKSTIAQSFEPRCLLSEINIPNHSGNSIKYRKMRTYKDRELLFLPHFLLFPPHHNFCLNNYKRSIPHHHSVFCKDRRRLYQAKTSIQRVGISWEGAANSSFLHVLTYLSLTDFYAFVADLEFTVQKSHHFHIIFDHTCLIKLHPWLWHPSRNLDDKLS